MNQDDKILSNYYIDKIKKQRVYFEYADVSQNLLENQKDEDLLMLQDSLVNWINGIPKDDKRLVNLNLLIKSVWRIQSYCGVLETVCKASTVSIVDYQDQIKKLNSEKRLLELENIKMLNLHLLEIKKLNGEIEFLTKNS